MTVPGPRGVESPLVGRDRELAQLRDHLLAATAGSPRLVLLEGEAGIGKSRLLRSAQLRAVSEGFTVLSGRCMEHLDLPYLPFQTALLPKLGEIARAEPSLHAVAGLIDEALDPADAPLDLAERAIAHGHARFLHAAARATLALCAGGPVLVGVDDLQWVDGPSVDLLTQLVLEAVDAAFGRPVRLLLLATLRPPAEGRIARELARLGREDACHRIEVGPLDEDGVAELLRAFGVARPSRQLTGAVRRSTSGNPLLLVSTARQLAGGRVRDDSGELAAVGSLEDLDVPDDVSQAVGHRIDELTPSSHEILAAAAVMGDPFTASAVAEVAGVTVEAATGALSEAAAIGLVTIEDGSASFAHPLFAHALRSSATSDRRRALHLAAARALAAAAAGDADAMLRVGLHLAAADGAAPPREVVDGCRSAGERAWQQAAWGEAAELFDAAAGAARRADPSALELAELLARAGAAHLRNLDPGPGRARLEEAVARFEARGDVVAAVRSLMELTHVEVAWGSYGRPVDVERLESVLPDVEASDPELCARGYVQLAEASWAQGRVSAATRHVDRALDLAERHGLTAVRSRAYLALAQARWLRLDLDAAHAALVSSLDAGRQTGDSWLAGLPLSRLALTLFWQGRLAEARTAADDARAYTDELANFAEKSLALAVLTCLALARGDFAEAEKHGEEAVSAIRISRYTWTASLVFPALVVTRLLQHDVIGARSALDRWADTMTAFGDHGSDDAIVLFDLLVDRYAEGPEYVRTRSLARLGAETLDRLAGLFGAQHVAALVDLADAGMPITARSGWLESLDYAIAHGMRISEGGVAVLARVRADLCATLGRTADAEAGYRDAIAFAESTGCRPEVARARLGLARLRSTVDPRGAAELALDAAAAFAELAMPAFEQDARSVIDAARPAEVPVEALVTSPGSPSDVLTSLGTVESGRQTAVLLFTDVVDSTRLTEELGDERYLAMAQELDGRVRASIWEHGGRTEDGIRPGDGLLAAFASGEDAVACAGLAHEHAASLGLRLHVGIHVGDVIRSRTGVHGAAVNTAARICALAPPGRTVVSSALRSIVGPRLAGAFEDFGCHQLKGISEPQLLFVTRAEAAA